MVRTCRLDREHPQLSSTKEAETQHRLLVKYSNAESRTMNLPKCLQRELKVLTEAIRNLDPNAESRVELMSGGEVLGTALIMWLKNAEDDIEIAKRVVKAVWPRMGAKRSQTHPEWAESCDTKMDLVTSIESWLRTNSARCERHLIKLEYLCPGCQHGMCTVCNDTASRTQCTRCTEPIPQIPEKSI